MSCTNIFFVVFHNWWANLGNSSLAQWVGAIATSSAVVVALFKDQILHHFRRPKLTISISPKSPDCVITPISTLDGQGNRVWTWKAYWLRLWIQNDGKEPAEQVQVFVSKVYKLGINKKPAQIENFLPMNLRWANGRDWKNPEVFAPGISSKPLGKHCDLCSISDPANPNAKLEGYEGKCSASLALEVYSSGNDHRLPPGEYIIEAIVAAANARPVTVYVALNLKGQWSADPDVMFRDYLDVRIVPGLS
jgi:hypothetical protein